MTSISRPAGVRARRSAARVHGRDELHRLRRHGRRSRGYRRECSRPHARLGSGARFDPGLQHMDGAQALAFSRNRHIPGGDFQRTADQALVILAALAKVQDSRPDISETLRLVGVFMKHGELHNAGPGDLVAPVAPGARAALDGDPQRGRPLADGSSGHRIGRVLPARGPGSLRRPARQRHPRHVQDPGQHREPPRRRVTGLAIRHRGGRWVAGGCRAAWSHTLRTT